jgi:hypothetical protein
MKAKTHVFIVKNNRQFLEELGKHTKAGKNKKIRIKSIV